MGDRNPVVTVIPNVVASSQHAALLGRVHTNVHSGLDELVYDFLVNQRKIRNRCYLLHENCSRHQNVNTLLTTEINLNRRGIYTVILNVLKNIPGIADAVINILFVVKVEIQGTLVLYTIKEFSRWFFGDQFIQCKD